MILALASKEEAVLLPFVLLAWQWRIERRITVMSVAAVLAPLALYLAVRSLTPAFTPATAPAFYQFGFAPALLARNLLAYADRSATIVVVVLCLGLVAVRSVPMLDDRAIRILTMCGIWWAGLLALTVWLPVRSSLYAVCPSVATALAGGLILDLARSASARPAAWRVECALAGALLAAVPIYQARNHVWVEAARVSQRTLAAVRADAPGLAPTGVIVLHDEAATVSNFHNAFGDLASEAFQTVLGQPWRVHVTTGASAAPAPRSTVVAEYDLDHGRVLRRRGSADRRAAPTRARAAARRRRSSGPRVAAT
jgi:hypothetical protein